MSSPQSSTAVSPIREASAYENGHQGRSAVAHKTPFEGKVFLYIFGWTEGQKDICLPASLTVWLFSVQVPLRILLNLPNTQETQAATFDLWVRPAQLSVPNEVNRVSLLSLSLWICDFETLFRSLQVRAAPPPPKQHPRGQVKRREEVEITLVWRQPCSGSAREEWRNVFFFIFVQTLIYLP